MGVSARYVQDLLQDTGLSFTERLLERRLQYAMRLLTSEQGDRMKVSDIALAWASMKLPISISDFGGASVKPRRNLGVDEAVFRAALSF